MVNLDMVGRLRESSVDVYGVGTSSAWTPLLAEASSACGLGVRAHAKGYGPSDHAPFYALSRPVLFFHTGTHAEFHLPSDTPERLNVGGISRISALVTELVGRLASTQEPMPFAEVGFEADPAVKSR